MRWEIYDKAGPKEHTIISKSTPFAVSVYMTMSRWSTYLPNPLWVSRHLISSLKLNVVSDPRPSLRASARAGWGCFREPSLSQLDLSNLKISRAYSSVGTAGKLSMVRYRTKFSTVISGTSDVYLPVSGSLVAYRLPYGAGWLIRTSGGRILAAGKLVPEINLRSCLHRLWSTHGETSTPPILYPRSP